MHDEINPVKDTGVIKKPVTISPEVEMYNCDSLRVPWVPDKSGYFVIRTVPEKQQIQVGVCDYKDINVIKKLYTSTIDDRIYQKILDDGIMDNAKTGGPLTRLYQGIIKTNSVSKLDHASYLGKELGRAFVALRLGYKFEQDGISL